MSSRKLVFTILTVGLVTGVAACGSSGSAAVPATSTGHKATGTPVKVMVILDESASNALISEPQNHAGISAGLLRINNYGGLGGSGRPVQVVYCDDELNPNTADACVRQAASDPSIVALIGTSVSLPVDSLIESSGLADIGAFPFIAGNFTDPNLFATNGGAISAGGGQANLMHTVLDKETLSAGVLAYPAAVENVAIQNAVLKSCGGQPVVRTVQVPVTATDVSSYVATMAQNVDGIITNTTPAQQQQYLLALQHQGSKVPLTFVDSELTPEAISSLGAAANGTPVVSYYPPDNVDVAGNRQYLADMAAAGETANLNDNAKASWVAMQLFSYAMKGATTFTRATILARMRNVSGFTAGGLTPPLNFSGTAPDSSYPRLFNLNYYAGEIENGKVVASGSSAGKPIPVFCGQK